VGHEATPDLGAHRVHADGRERIERDFVFNLRVEDRLVAAVAGRPPTLWWVLVVAGGPE